jgi:hypothetical protein
MIEKILIFHIVVPESLSCVIDGEGHGGNCEDGE